MNQNQENFIKIDEVIKKAKERGVDFGNANPRSRLRYYAKLDLLPPAERKVFEGNQPTGAYPQRVVDLLVEIDEEIDKGKSIKEVAQEKKRQKQEQELERSKQAAAKDEGRKKQRQQKEETKEKSEKEKSEKEDQQTESLSKAEVSYQVPPFTLIPTYSREEESESRSSEQDVQKPKKKRLAFRFFTPALKFITFALLVACFGYVLGVGVARNKIPGKFLATLPTGRLTAQLTQSPPTGTGPGQQESLPQTTSPGEGLFGLNPTPYLSINVETDINAPLNLKSTTTPELSFYQDNYQGKLTVEDLSGDRTYNLPDQSGTVCLSSGNCFQEGRVTSPGGAVNRLAKFVNEDTIGVSSIRDNYTGGALVNITDQGKFELLPSSERDVAVLGSSDSPLRIESEGELGLIMDSEGQVGIGKTDPDSQLDVEGTIQASEDVCVGGKCLSEVSGGGAASRLIGAGGNISGSGNSGNLALWSGSSQIKSSALYESNSQIGLGNESPSSLLDVSGTITMEGFKMPTNATSNYVLTATSSGVGTWEPLPVTRPKGDPGQTLRHDGSTWIANSFLTNLGDAIGIGTSTPSSTLAVVGTTTSYGDNVFKPLSSNLNGNSAVDSPAVTLSGYYDATSSTTSIEATATQFSIRNVVGYNSAAGQHRLGLFNNGGSEVMSVIGGTQRVGIGTTSPSRTLSVNGSGWFGDSLTVSTSGTSQLSLKNGTNSLAVLVNATETKFTASGDLVFNTDGGEIRTNASLVDASNATMTASTFVSATGDATVRSSDEYVLRASVSIFPYERPAQTATSNYRKVSKSFTSNSLASATPDLISGATRTYAFLINYADNLATTATTSWQIDKSSGSNVTFAIKGQDIDSNNLLNRGYPHLTDFYDLAGEWHLDVKPKGNKVMIHDIYLLVYDKVE